MELTLIVERVIMLGILAAPIVMVMRLWRERKSLSRTIDQQIGEYSVLREENAYLLQSLGMVEQEERIQRQQLQALEEPLADLRRVLQLRSHEAPSHVSLLDRVHGELYAFLDSEFEEEPEQPVKATKKRRVYELAKERGIKGQDLVVKLRELGFSYIKSHMTALVEFQVLEIELALLS